MRDDTNPCTPAEILERQARIAPTLVYLATFRHQPVIVQDAPLPIPDEVVAAWIAQDRARAKLTPGVAKALAYLDSFRGQERRPA